MLCSQRRRHSPAEAHACQLVGALLLHVRHRLANALGGKKKSVLFIYLMCLCLGTSAIVLRNARPVDAILLIIQACIMVGLVTVLERRGRLANGSLKSKR